jgi:hypothetical protein
MKKLRTVLILACLFSTGIMFAQFRGGQIEYSILGNNQYQFKLTTYIDSVSVPDQCRAVLEVWNDSGTILLHRDTLNRQNGPLGPCGSMIGSGEYIGGGMVRNDYSIIHTLPSGERYNVRSSAMNYSQEIANADTGNPMVLQLELLASAFLSAGNGPLTGNDSPLVACMGQSSVFDQDWIAAIGDSTVFALVDPPNLPGYVPLEDLSDTITIGRSSGIVELINPYSQGCYLLSMSCDNYRNGFLISTHNLIRTVKVADTCVGVNISEQIQKEFLAELGIRLFPNPASATFRLKLPATITNCKLRILDISGREVLAKSKYPGGEVNIESLAVGIYIVEVSTLKGLQRLKLVRE